MDLSGIISISGKPGLYNIVAHTKNGIIVEGISDGKRFPAYATHRISALEDISIYTVDDDVPLADVYRKIYDKENGGPAVSHKASANELKAYLEEVLPDFDEERVYMSDIKKMMNWYNLLQSKDMLKLPTEEGAEASAEATEETTEAEAPTEAAPEVEETESGAEAEAEVESEETSEDKA